MDHNWMSLKDEIETLIQAEQVRLKVKEQRECEYLKTRCVRITALKEILREITSPIEPRYVEVDIDDDCARVRLHYHRTGLHWTIKPDSAANFGVESDDNLLESGNGFLLSEIIYHFDGKQSIKEKNFDSLQLLVEYLVSQIVERAAQIRHWQSIAEAIMQRTIL